MTDPLTDVAKALTRAQRKKAAKDKILARVKELGFDRKTIAKETLDRWVDELMAKEETSSS